jgi:integrase
MEQLVATAQDRKSGQEVAKNPTAPETTYRDKTPRRAFPKTHSGYWKSRLEHRSYTYRGQSQETGGWSVRIKHLGVRRSFELDEPTREEAAAKARDIYLSLVAKGWEATLVEFSRPGSPTPTAQSGEPTVGSFLAEVERVAGLKARTFHRYAQYFRMVVAQIRGIAADKSKYDYHNGRLAAWREKVDSTLLRFVTPEAAANWRLAYLSRAGDDPQRKLEVNRSFNAVLRHCKSLFSPRVINQPNFAVVVPRFTVRDGQRGEREAYWFEVLKFEKNGSMKFRVPVGVSYEGLVHDARSELRSEHTEAYKLFLLCLCAGLRRAEADTLLWNQLNQDDNSISIEQTAYLQPKHDSGGVVYVDAALMNELQGLKSGTTTTFVVNSPWRWKRTTYNRYRCEPHWETLLNWLGSKGITARKKVHELRKLFGDAIVKRNGIFAGSAQLRHSTIQMTASHYADPRQRAVLPVGALLEAKTSAG